jgi:hypothetical protein
VWTTGDNLLPRNLRRRQMAKCRDEVDAGGLKPVGRDRLMVPPDLHIPHRITRHLEFRGNMRQSLRKEVKSPRRDDIDCLESIPHYFSFRDAESL